MGRAGRTNDECSEAIARGEFETRYGDWDYSVKPSRDTGYCGPCFAALLNAKRQGSP